MIYTALLLGFYDVMFILGASVYYSLRRGGRNPHGGRRGKRGLMSGYDKNRYFQRRKRIQGHFFEGEEDAYFEFP